MKLGFVSAILPEYSLEPVPVHAVFPNGPRPSTKVRALLDHLSDAMRAAALMHGTKPANDVSTGPVVRP